MILKAGNRAVLCPGISLKSTENFHEEMTQMKFIFEDSKIFKVWSLTSPVTCRRSTSAGAGECCDVLLGLHGLV